MIQLNTILVPTDFSEYAKPALIYACALAEKFESQIHLLHIVQDLIAAVPEPGLAFPPPGDYLQDLTTSADNALKKMAKERVPAGIDVITETRQGPPFLEIIRYAKANNIDLICMGTHGRSGLAHALLGSVAEKVVRKAPSPVLTIHPSDHQFAMP